MNGFPDVSNLVRLTSFRALHNTNDRYLNFIGEGGDTESTLTFGELDHAAKCIAAGLCAEKLDGRNVVLLYAPGVDYVKSFFGCLYAGVVPVPAYPPMGARDISRLINVVRDSDAAAVLSSSNLMPMIEVWINNPSNNMELPCLSTDVIEMKTDASGFESFDAEPNDIAFLQYTSGSTGHPKGVMITHGNLMANFDQILNSFVEGNGEYRDNSDTYTTVIWLPPFHDMGLIGGLLTPVYAGASVGLMSPITFLKNPFVWLKTITDMKAKVSGGPNFSYQYCARKITDEQILQLDLTSLKVAFNGAEPINLESLNQFSERFSSCGFNRKSFLPCYGLAEATLFVSGSPAGRGVNLINTSLENLSSGEAVDKPFDTKANENVASTPLVSTGIIAKGTDVRIVNPVSLEECVQGDVGEIWMRGPSIANGYWDKPAFSEKVFNAKIEGEDPNDGYLRSGDLGFLADGELFVTGRIKELIILSGRNHYPQDIELTFQQSSRDLRRGCGAAFSSVEHGQEELVIMQEIDKARANESSAMYKGMVNTAVKDISSRYGIRPSCIVLIAQGTLPKTSSGKIQRGEAKKLYQSGNFVPVFSWQSAQKTLTQSLANNIEENNQYSVDWHHSLEEKMKNWVGEKLNIESHLVDLNVPFSDLGVDSIEAIDLVDSLQNIINRSIPATEMMRYSTVKILIDHLANEITQVDGADNLQSRDQQQSQQAIKEAILK